MGSIALDRTDVIVGVDTQKYEHVAVVIDGLGGRLGELYVAASPGGYAELLDWARALGSVYALGVEGTGSYGLGLARFLRRHAQTVIEVSRPPRAGERRLDGKSDPLDAENAARQVLAGRAVSRTETGRWRGRGDPTDPDRTQHGGEGPTARRSSLSSQRWSPPPTSCVTSWNRRATSSSCAPVPRSTARAT
jgi:Transposase